MKRLSFLLLAVLLSGCIRFNAGVWKQGPNDEAPKGKQIGFATDDLLPSESRGSIEMGDEP